MVGPSVRVLRVFHLQSSYDVEVNQKLFLLDLALLLQQSKALMEQRRTI